MAREKGATVFDKLCHRVFAANGNGANYLSAPTGVSCGHCGTELEFYYCEERLYVIECHRCKTRALVEAGNAAQAAYKTFGHEVAVYDPDSLGFVETEFEKWSVTHWQLLPELPEVE